MKVNILILLIIKIFLAFNYSCARNDINIKKVYVNSKLCQEDKNIIDGDTFSILEIVGGFEASQVDIDRAVLSAGYYNNENINFILNNFSKIDSLRFSYDSINFNGYTYRDSVAESQVGYNINVLILYNSVNNYISVLNYDSLDISSGKIVAFVSFRDKTWKEDYIYCSSIKQFVH